jgi:FRG domain
MRTYHRYLLNEARLRGFDHHEGVKLCDLELLALLQHYGAATHLLDITRDVTTALWFASEDPETTGVVIAFDESGIRP